MVRDRKEDKAYTVEWEHVITTEAQRTQRKGRKTSSLCLCASVVYPFLSPKIDTYSYYFVEPPFLLSHNGLGDRVGRTLGTGRFYGTAHDNWVWDLCGLLRIFVRRSYFRGPGRGSWRGRRGDGRQLADVPRKSGAHGNFAS